MAILTILRDLNAPKNNPQARQNSSNMFALPAKTHTDARVLSAGAAEVYTLPAGASIVVFSATADFYANYDEAAAVPGADVTDGTASELNPVVRDVQGITSIGLISPSSCVVTMLCYSHPGNYTA